MHIYRPRIKVQHLVIFIILWEMQSFPLVVLQICKSTNKMFVSIFNEHSLKSNHVRIRCPPSVWEQGEQCIKPDKLSEIFPINSSNNVLLSLSFGLLHHVMLPSRCHHKYIEIIVGTMKTRLFRNNLF
jgi:hypothetical protein